MKRKNVLRALMMSAVLCMSAAMTAGVSTPGTLLFGSGRAAASENDDENDNEGTQELTVDITKIYKLLNENTTGPTQEFTFKVEKYSVTDSSVTGADAMPMLTASDGSALPEGKVTVKYETGDQSAITVTGSSKTVNLKFPAAGAAPGVYTYKITEEAGASAGIVYDSKAVYARVTVLNDGNGGVYVASVEYTYDVGDGGKNVPEFTNVYRAGALTIQKNVTGNLGDKSKYFAVEVMLTGVSGETYPSEGFTVNSSELSYKADDGSGNPSTVKLNEKATFYIKDGETISIANLPYGVTYTVAESDYTSAAAGGYDAPTYTVNNGGVPSVSNEAVDSAEEAVVITNKKDTLVDTGIVLDNLPYILLLLIVAAGAVWMVLRRRTDTDRD